MESVGEKDVQDLHSFIARVKRDVQSVEVICRSLFASETMCLSLSEIDNEEGDIEFSCEIDELKSVARTAEPK